MSEILTTRGTACPYIGIFDDPGAYFGYPCSGNRCFHCRPAATPSVVHQEAFCLSGMQYECPVYSQEEGATIPSAIRMRAMPTNWAQRRRKPGWIFLYLALIVLLTGLAGYEFVPNIQRTVNALRPQAPMRMTATRLLPTPGATRTAVNAPMLGPVVSEMGQVTPTPGIPSPNAATQACDLYMNHGTPCPPSLTSPPHALELPVTVDGLMFVIHSVTSGQTFETLAQLYGTTPDAILALNYKLKPPLRAATQIVIAPGMKSVIADLPAFEAYQVTGDPTTIERLARELTVDADLLRHYNACPGDCALNDGDWIIVPR